jgi:thiol-disulfide isomerase/thioredoxin
MSKIALLTTTFFLYVTTITFSQGIRFESTDWKTIVSRAKTEKKMIFVDFYTTWCGPCKRLEKEVFTLPEVGLKYNNSFINARIDAEKGEGVELAARFGVSAYPSSVFIKADDESVVYKIVGFMAADKYLIETDAALDALVKDPFVDLEFEYQKGNRSIGLLTKMIIKKQLIGRPVDRELEDFFTNHWVDSFFIPQNERIIKDLKMDVNGKAFDILMQRVGQVNQSSFYTLKSPIKLLIDRNLMAGIKTAREKRDEATLERILSYASLLWTYSARMKNPDIPKYQMLFYRHGDDPDKLVQATAEYMTIGYLMSSTTLTQTAARDATMKQVEERMKRGNVSETMKTDSATLAKVRQNQAVSASSQMNIYYAKEFVEILQPYLDFVTDPKAFRLAKEWSKRLTELEGNAQNLSIHAQILFKGGDKTEAIAVLQGAIEKAKKEQYSEKDMGVLTILLKKMNE